MCVRAAFSLTLSVSPNFAIFRTMCGFCRFVVKPERAPTRREIVSSFWRRRGQSADDRTSRELVYLAMAWYRRALARYYVPVDVVRAVRPVKDTCLVGETA